MNRGLQLRGHFIILLNLTTTGLRKQTGTTYRVRREHKDTTWGEHFGNSAHSTTNVERGGGWRKVGEISFKENSPRLKINIQGKINCV